MPFHWDQGFTICRFVFFFWGGAFTQSVAQGKLFVVNTGFYTLEWIHFVEDLTHLAGDSYNGK